MYETLSRIQLPPFDQIPDASQLKALSSSNAERWVIPNTEIVIERMKSGPHSGEFLFSAGTVARAEEFYERVHGLAYTRPVPLEHFREITMNGGGWMIPFAWVKALPSWLRAPACRAIGVEVDRLVPDSRLLRALVATGVSPVPPGQRASIRFCGRWRDWRCRCSFSWPRLR